MKLAFTSPTLGFAGGAELYAFQMARSLRARGHEVVLLAGPERGADPTTYAAAFDAVSPLTGGHQSFDAFYVYKTLSERTLASFDGALVFATHDHDFSCVRSHRYLPLTERPCHRSPGPGCVARLCFLRRDRRPGGLPIRLQSPFELRRRVAHLAQRGSFTACSEYVAKGLVGAGVPANRVDVVYPIPPAPSAERVAPPERPSLLVVASLLRGKGVDLAIAAMRALPAEVDLVIVGDGPERKSLEAQALATAKGRVHFEGRLPPDQVRARYDACSAVVVPSRWPEPFGMVGVEALQRGRPVVAADHGGVPEWLEVQAGCLGFRPGDVQSLARALRGVLAKPSDASSVRTRHSHRKSVLQLEEVLGRRARLHSADSARGDVHLEPNRHVGEALRENSAT